MKLVLGCSYTEKVGKQESWHDTLFDEPYKVFAMGGVDNNWIARTGLHLIKDYDSVFVMFTGIDRISVEMPQDCIDKDYYFCFPIGCSTGHGKIHHGDVNLVQSGGPAGSWNEQYSGPAKNVFKAVYNTDKKNYFSQLNMYHVVMFLNFLKAQRIPFKYTFVYDIVKDYFEHSLGQCTDYLDMLDRTHYIPVTPYEFGLKNNGFQEDGFHLTPECQTAWAREVKKYL